MPIQFHVAPLSLSFTEAIIGHLSGQYEDTKPVSSDADILAEALVSEYLRRAATGEAPKKISYRKLLEVTKAENEKINEVLSKLLIYQHNGYTVVSNGQQHEYLKPSPTPYHQQIFFDRQTTP